MEYQDYNDYELINYIAEGNEDAHDIILEKYYPLVKGIAGKLMSICKNTGLEISDLEQEGMIGLMSAIDSFDEQKDTVFYTYARTCIQRKMISSIIRSKRLKHRVLNESLSFDSDDVNIQLLKDDINIPENIIVNNDNTKALITKIETNLTSNEKQVFELLKLGFSYKEISEILEKSSKSIDNTIQRIKKKLKDILKQEDN